MISEPNNYLLTGDNSGEIKIWDWQNSKIVYQEKLCKDEKVAGFGVSRDFQNILVGCVNRKILFFGK